MNLLRSEKHLPGIVLLLALVTTVLPVSAMMNPAAGYCTALGYTYSSQPDTQGDYVGYCTLPDGRSLYAWDFLLGETGQDYSWCAKMGYASRVVNDIRACGPLEQPGCLACVFPNGSAMEVTQAMGLDFREKVCFEDTCSDPKDSPLPRYLINPPKKPEISPHVGWMVPAGLIIVILLIAGLVAWNRRKGKAG